MAASEREPSGGDVSGGLLSVLLCVSGSVLALLALPALFGTGAGPMGFSALAAASGGGLLVAGIGLSLGPSSLSDTGVARTPTTDASGGSPGHGAV